MLKKTVVAMLLFVISFSGAAYAYNVQLQPYIDETFDYSRESIYALSALGVIAGFPDRTFRPDEKLTREAFLKMLVTAAKTDPGNDAQDEVYPADVDRERWSAPYISIAMQRNWIDHLIDRDGFVHPAKVITRQEVAAVIGKYLLMSEPEHIRTEWLTAGWQQERDSRRFQDRSAMDESLQPYVYYTVHQGLMAGEPSGFKPQEPLIRKQAAAVIYRLIQQQIEDKQIDFIGYYAIRSYGALEHVSKLSHVIFGWSHLSYDTKGTASLVTGRTVNRIPEGYEEVVAAADQASASKELMVFYDRDNLKLFLRDFEAQQAFFDSLFAKLDDPSFGFTGVSIDFEGLKEADSAADFVAFLRELKGRLGERTLSVAVPPVYYYHGYDLKQIGEIADTVILMAYDFTHHESKLPSAPLPLVNDTVQTALAVIPKEKLVLGISKQANQWITANGITAPPASPAIADVERRLTMAGVTETWRMPYFMQYITFEDERGAHEIYYEDTRSIAQKILLAKYYDLKGVSLWFMGSFTEADWALIGEHAAN